MEVLGFLFFWSRTHLFWRENSEPVISCPTNSKVSQRLLFVVDSEMKVRCQYCAGNGLGSYPGLTQGHWNWYPTEIELFAIKTHSHLSDVHHYWSELFPCSMSTKNDLLEVLSQKKFPEIDIWTNKTENTMFVNWREVSIALSLCGS